MLNTDLKGKYESAITQLYKRFNQSLADIAQINNDQVTALFGKNKQYIFEDQTMPIDETLAAYSLSVNGESMQVIGTPVGGNICDNINVFGQPVTYVGVSTSFIQNTFWYLANST